MIIKYAIALAILLAVAAFMSWAFLPARYLPGNRAQLPVGHALVIRGGCTPVVSRLPRARKNPPTAGSVTSRSSRHLSSRPPRQWSSACLLAGIHS